MKDKNDPGRALAAYYRRMARRHRVALPLDDLPTRICEETIAEKAYVIMGNGTRMLAVYRVRPDGGLRWLKRWPKGLERRP
jgi:hypothetical protein